jgi:catechol 2,3-dioxygenase-like lactoylglutathione lyase family enzyme
VNATAKHVWDHTSLTVRDLEASLAFYRRAFGYELVLENRGMSQSIETIVGLPGLRADLVQLRAAHTEQLLELVAFSAVPTGREDHGPTRPGAAHVAFRVEDFDAGLAAARGLGARLLGEVTWFGTDRPAAYLREPGGSVVELSRALRPGEER